MTSYRPLFAPFLSCLTVAAGMLWISGCASWTTAEYDRSPWNLSRLRDPRAVDIDGRLAAPPTSAAPQE